MHGARSTVVNITGGSDLSLAEASEATTFITRVADPEANVIYGIVTNEMLRNAVRVTVIATGFEAPAQNGNGVRADAATAAAPETSAKPANGNSAAEAHPPRVGFMRRMWRGRGATA